MTIARAAAIGSLIVAIIAVGVLMFGSGGGTEYTVHLQSANQLVKGNEVKVGGLAIGEITDIKLSEDNQADVKVTINDEDFAPLHEGTDGDGARDLAALGRQPLHLAARPARTTRPRCRRAASSRPTRRPTRSTSTSCSTRSTRRRARACSRRSRDSRPGTRARATTSSKTFKYLGPSLGNFTRVMQELGRDQKTFTDLVVQGARATSAIASRRDDLADAGLEREHVRARDRRGERVLRPRARGFPGGARGGQQDVREPARRARRAEQADERLRSRATKSLAPFLQRPRRPAQDDAARRSRTCACSSTTRARTTTRPTSCAGCRALEQLARKSTKNSVAALKAGPGRDRVPAAVRARHLGLAHALRPGPGLLRRERPLRARAADLQRLLLRPGRQPAQLAEPRPSATARQLRGGNRFCPGAATQPAPDGSNPFPTTAS